ncbi:hypothetical protein [Ralstonia sp. Ralssp110]|uniref:hypothetical protein n=1 Tax=Ralstonia sp. Ralssp110 TaxID=3243004 RepID=UPI0039B4D30C
MTHLAQVCKAVFDGYGNSDAVGIAYFDQHAAALANLDYALLLSHQAAHYPHRYVLDFILGTAALWQPLGASFWERYLLSAQRPHTSDTLDQVAAFADIEFLSRYVGVDALGYLWQSADHSKRLALSVYFAKHPYALVPSALDEADLDGIYFVCKTDLELLRDKLTGAMGFQRAVFDDAGAEAYLSHLAGQLELP